jgi:hypothetical protein
MRITLVRSGGFANIAVRREIDTAMLPAGERKALEQLAARARLERAAPNAEPDGFEYEVDIDGARYVVDGSSPAWHALIECVSNR